MFGSGAPPTGQLATSADGTAADGVQKQARTVERGVGGRVRDKCERADMRMKALIRVLHGAHCRVRTPFSTSPSPFPLPHRLYCLKSSQFHL